MGIVANITGPQGPAGPSGATWYTGTGMPSSLLGVNGDLYLDTATGFLYEKISGTWQVTGQLTTQNGLPTGGTIGQVLLKNSGTNFDVSWGSALQFLDAGAPDSVYGGIDAVDCGSP